MLVKTDPTTSKYLEDDVPNIMITAADERFLPHLSGWLNSAFAAQMRYTFAIGILDVGLSRDSAHELQAKVDHLVVPDWDIPLDSELKTHKPHLRSLIARPFLRKYFPDYNTYFWLDCDAWIQEPSAVSAFFEAATSGGIAIVAQRHQRYKHTAAVEKWRISRLQRYFQSGSLELYRTNPYYNAGGFALQVNAAHWKAWEKSFKLGIDRDRSLICDQTSLNYALWQGNLSVVQLPATYNWCCHLAKPTIKVTKNSEVILCEPGSRSSPIKIVHQTGNTKDLYIHHDFGNVSLRGGLGYRGLKLV